MTLLAEIQHVSHPCRLQLMFAKAPYRCNGCEDTGFEPCYQCQRCDFHLHVPCASGVRCIAHPFQNDPLYLFAKKLGAGLGLCFACGKNIQGFMYQSLKEGGPRIHPCCLNLKPRITAQGMSLILKDKIPLLSKCEKCGRRKLSGQVRGWAYFSTSDRKYLHVACAKACLEESSWNAHLRQEGEGGSPLNWEPLHGEFAGREASWNWTPMMRSLVTVIFSALLGEGISAVVDLL